MVRKPKISKIAQIVVEFANSYPKLGCKGICAQLVDQKLVDLSKEEIKQILKERIPRFKSIILGSDEKKKDLSSNRKRAREESTENAEEEQKEEEKEEGVEKVPSNKKSKHGDNSSKQSQKKSENSKKVQASDGDLVKEVEDTEEVEKEFENAIAESEIEDTDSNLAEEPFTQPTDVISSNRPGKTKKSNVFSNSDEQQTSKKKNKKTKTKKLDTPNSKVKETTSPSEKVATIKNNDTPQKKKQPPHEVPPPQPHILNSSFLANNQQKKQIESFSLIDNGDPKKIRLFIDGISKVTAVTDKLHILHALYVSNGNAKTAIDLLCKVGMDKTLIWTPHEDALVLKDQKPISKNNAEIEDRQKFLARVMQN